MEGSGHGDGTFPLISNFHSPLPDPHIEDLNCYGGQGSLPQIKRNFDAMNLDAHARESRKDGIQRKMIQSVGGVDRMSRLSDDLLVIILSFLTLTEAVRTSILSKRWKHLWSLLPFLDFTMSFPQSLSKVNMASQAISIMSTVLPCATRQLLDLTLYLPYGYKDVYKKLDKLLELATYKNIRGRLIVMIDNPYPKYALPLHFLSCTSITQLHVHNVILSPNPKVCLSALKVLQVHDSTFRVEEFERLTSSECCPILETLELKNCNINISLIVKLTNPSIKYLYIHFSVVQIDAMSHIYAAYVTHLKLSGAWRAYAIKYCSSLLEATFDFTEYHFLWEKRDKVAPEVVNMMSRTLYNIFACLSSSVKINISSGFLQVPYVISMEDVALSLVNVKHLFLKLEANFMNFFPTLGIFFGSFKVVEHLTIELPPNFYVNLNCPMNCLCSGAIFCKYHNKDVKKKYCMFLKPYLPPNYNVRTIVVDGFYEGDDEEKTKHGCTSFRRSWQFVLIKIMLKRSRKLEKMIIQSSRRQLKMPLQIVEMCCSLPRESAAVLVFPSVEGMRDEYVSLKSTAIGDGDRVSRLSDKLLIHILSFLSLRNAVRTSSLSKRWKKIWRRLPGLDFTSIPSRLSFDEAAQIIDYVISMNRPTYPRSAFSLCITDQRPHIHHKLDSWISCAVFQKVRCLDLCLPDSYVLLTDVFLFSRLMEQLKLSNCAIVLPDRPFCFSSLKSMHISHSQLEPLVLNRLTSSSCSPVLETLQIICCNKDIAFGVSLTNPSLKHFSLDNKCSKNVDIFAPFLTHLELGGNWKKTEYVLQDVSSVSNASFAFNEVISARDGSRALFVLMNLITALPSSVGITFSFGSTVHHSQGKQFMLKSRISI